MKIQKITKLPSDIEELLRASENEGFAFIKRLKSDWEDSTNRFDSKGEFLLSATTGGMTVGVCGVNNDPYVQDSNVSRLRHLYVLPAYRSQAIGSALVRNCLGNLSDFTRSVRLRVPEKNTGIFYEKLGFIAVKDISATHIFTLDR